MNEAVLAVAQKIANASAVVVLTGAGISKESGIPTFRDAQTGLWSKYDPQELATPQGFERDPGLVWRWYDYRRRLVEEALPNAGHRTLVDLETLLPVTIVTQNVDELHARAGSSDIIELHGSLLKFFCFDKHHQADDVARGLTEPPRCHCGSLIRPAVVWFNESLPAQVLERASRLMMEAELVLVIGTSGIVQPAASLPYTARRHGAYVVEINQDRTPVSDVANVLLQGPAGEILPAVMQQIRKKKPPGN